VTDYASYAAQHQAANRERDAAVKRIAGENEVMREMLRGFVTPPLAYARKRELVERVTLFLEGWGESAA
jgi:hypothetical protein